MSRGFRRITSRALCLLAVFGLLAATPGCDQAPRRPSRRAAVPANVKESNKNMEDFMNSQKKK